MIDDSSAWVREAVARQGYGLDILVHDDVFTVRAAVASQGYALDVLVYSEK